MAFTAPCPRAKSYLRLFLAIACIVVSLAAMINVFADNDEVLAQAKAIACRPRWRAIWRAWIGRPLRRRSISIHARHGQRALRAGSDFLRRVRAARRQ